MILKQIIILLATTIHIGINAELEFTNIKCTPKDPAYLTFEYCFLRSVNRTYKYISLKTHFYQLPINNLTFSFQMLKRDSKMVFNRLDATVDGCRFMKKRGNPFVNFIFNIFLEYTNMNHTCPYNHDIYLEKLPVHHVNNIMGHLFPNGRYYFNSTWFMFNKPRGQVTVYFTKS